MKTLHLMGLDFTYKAAIRGYESAIVTRVWNGIGSMELTINSGIPNADLIAQDDIIWFDNDYHKAHIVETIEITQSGSNKTYLIRANHLNVLLRDFITIPPIDYDYDVVYGSREVIVRTWVDRNCINPVVTKRKQYPLVLGALNSVGSTLTEQTRLKNLADEVARVLTTDDLGWCIELDIPNDQFVFNVYDGVNRTAGQSVNSRILFGMRYGNVANYRKIIDKAGARNVAFVGGQGEGADRAIVEVDSAGTDRRKEIFVDARDIELDADLPERGLQTLTETKEVDSYEFEALERQFVYERDYDLGDYVTVVMDKGDYQDLQIQRLEEIYERGNIKVIPQFGKTEATLSSKINAMSSRIVQHETAVVPGAVPPGCIILSGAADIPRGWLECDGQAVGRTAYPKLYAAIGITYGAGNGSTTFNLPNLKGRVPVGLDTGQAEFNDLGETGGAKTHTLTETEIPAHTHGQRIYNTGTAGTAGTQGGATANNATAGTTVATGGGGAHNNLQPYIVLRYIIKY